MTIPVIAIFVLTDHVSQYVIFEYADHSRTVPEKLTASKQKQLESFFTPEELAAYNTALINRNQWIQVK